MRTRYQYKCDECNDEKEVIHRMTEDPEVICGRCGIRMHRVPGNVVVNWNTTGGTR